MNSVRLLLTTCVLAASAQADAATRVYDVDPAYRQEVYEILSEMLDVEFANFGGRVQLLPTGQIVVDTFTDERQAQVAEVLAAIANSEPGETPMVTLRYWVLQGTPGGDNTGPLPGILNDVIRELESTYGDLGIEVLEAATVSGQSGGDAVMETQQLVVVQSVQANDDQLNASIVLETSFQELVVDVSMTRGQFLVLNSALSSDGVIALIVNWPDAD